MSERGKAISVLTMSTLAFTACFAVWMMNGVLVTFLVENGIFHFDKVQIGWLIGIPVLTGSIGRLPVGILTDRHGGRAVFPVVMLGAAAAAFGLSYANGFASFLLGSLGFGLAGTSFAVGIAYTSLWFPRERQGTALGIFGAGNAGSALTSLGAPLLLDRLTAGGANPEGWRSLPRLYAAALVAMTVLFLLFTHPRRAARAAPPSLGQQLSLLRVTRVWRFGLYYFLVFGGFVALAQWLLPYYVGAYGVPLATAGVLASVFSLPSGVIRALGGWMSDRFGARKTMYVVLGCCVAGCLLLAVPRMDVTSPGEGVVATGKGVVTAVTAGQIVAGEARYPLTEASDPGAPEGRRLLPTSVSWQEPVVKVGDVVKKKQLLARGVTRISFQANIGVFTALVFVVGIAMGIGKAAVYRYIPDYFPDDVGVVGGIVGVIGGTGGFVCPIVFGYMLRATGLWTTCWMFLFVVAIVSIAWLRAVVLRIRPTESAPASSRTAESSVVGLPALGRGLAGEGPLAQ